MNSLELRGVGALIREMLETKVTVESGYSNFQTYPGLGYETTVDGVPIKIVLRQYVGEGHGSIRAVVKYGDVHIMITGYTSDSDDSWGQGYESDTWDGSAQEVEYREVTKMDWVPV